MLQTLKSLNIRKQQNSGILYDGKTQSVQKSDSFEIYENTNNSSEGIMEKEEKFKMNVFEDNDSNWFYKEENEDLFAEKNNLNVYNFINFDL